MKPWNREDRMMQMKFSYASAIYVSSSTLEYDETGLRDSIRCRCARMVVEYGEESFYGGRRNSSLHWNRWYTSAMSKAEGYDVLTNKWQVYLRSIWNESEQCLYLVTQRSQFFRYFHTKMSRLQWKPFLVYEMHCWSLRMLSFGEAFSVADTDNIDGTNQQQLIQFSSRIWCPQIVQFNWHHWMRRAIREKIHNLN